jgi:hypothetical protein
MFRRRRKLTRSAVPLGALIVSALLVLPAIGDSPPSASPPKTPPQLFAPPLFSASGQALTVTAVVTGQPKAVRLVVERAGETTSYPMEADGDGVYSGTVPASDVGSGELSYAVSAEYDRRTNTSQAGRLVVLDAIEASSPKQVSRAGEVVAELGLGSGTDELGVSDNTEGARQLPASFVVDDAAGVVRILDTVKARLVDADSHGVRSTTKLANGSTTATDVVRGRDGAVLVLDQVRDEVVEVSSRGQRAVSGVGARTRDGGSRLAFRSDTIFVSDAVQGRFVPLVTKGRKTTADERSARSSDGLPTSIGAVAAQVDGNSVLFGLDAGTNSGFRVTFADQVLDAAEVTVDGAGRIWSLVGVYREPNAAMSLVSVDPETGTSEATPVGVSVPGDVTRRLVAAADGVVLMEGTEQSLRFVRFGGEAR